MQHPLPDLEEGDRLNQEEIEEIFDTNFGYRTSGINVRRDADDDRYILLFANEDGPYDDNVRQGQFTYIGEGLSGDQKESAPGNAALIDAVEEPVPIYFFYKDTGRSKWEYQGQVAVSNYEYVERSGRKVFEFGMEHMDLSSEESTTPKVGLYLVAVSDEWLSDFENTVVSPLDLSDRSNIPLRLEGYDRLRAWGTTETESAAKQKAIDQLSQSDIVLFYNSGEFIGAGRIARYFESSAVGEYLWDNPESSHIYLVKDFTRDTPGVAEVSDLLGYEGDRIVQSSLLRVSEDRVQEVLEEYDSLSAALFDENDDVDAEPSSEEIEREREAIEQLVETEPELTEDETVYTESRRRARDSGFAELVKEAYDHKCAICGARRESPQGGFEVEAAHIYPKSQDGTDDPRNGITLCRLHHWAFDSGWLSVSDDYQVIVQEAPAKQGYHEFKQLEGNKINLPEKELQPDSLYLSAHRNIHGFNE
ncbi:HNH endonuclease [Natrinema limicola]|uniref:HNH nuclease domain-containing protein n=1 Tax=Natrinema limicola JCM 13563 TaxID=1230457 RepID=M0CRQ9_9EURY|nr:HNH endonuclease [Natrinema limicola]ELZ25911.1 hypothetical protein C476_00632 [Natrinema limicola JCM 13563]